MPVDPGNDERFEKAEKAVYRLLKYRLRSKQEIRDKLSQLKIPAAIAEKAVRHFEELELIDDLQFARQWAASRLKKPFGLNRIRMELKKKGIDGAIINDVLTEVAREFDELDVVVSLAQYRAGKYHDIDQDKVKQRVYGYLKRRGFRQNAILKAVEQI